MTQVFRAMNPHRASVLSTILTLLILGSIGIPTRKVRAADPEPLPTAPDLHKMFDSAQYQPLLAKLARVLQLKGDAARPYDRVDLSTLKADTLLQLKQQASAIASLNDAVKAITDQTDPKVAAQARATLVLLKHSQALAYTPKNPPSSPISILDMTKRKTAYTALLADMHAEVAAKAKTAKAGKTLPPIIEALRGISDLRAVEMMAKDTDADSSQIAEDLASQAKTLMSDAVQTMSKRGAEIDADANTVLTNPASNAGRTRGTQTNAMATYKKGLDTKSANELKQIVDTCTKIESLAKDFQDVSKQNAAGFKEIADTADHTAKAATTTLNADYRK
jgi:hypothetical protein